MNVVAVQGQVGPQVLSDGLGQTLRLGRSGEAVVQELHGRFYEQNFRGNLYSGGTSTSIASATYTTATLTSLCTPIVGVWNPAESPVNLVILQVKLSLVLNALTATGGAPFMYATSLGNGAITTSVPPLNLKSLTSNGGGQGRDVSNVALTGLTNNLSVRHAAAVGGGSVYSVSEVATSAGFLTANAPSVDNLDGSIIVPPGGVLALLASQTPVAISTASAIVWEEVPL